MTGYDGAILWCVAQAALLAGLGVAASWVFMRKAPASAALIGAASLSSIVLATLLVPSPMPRLGFNEAAEAHRSTATTLPSSNENAGRDSVPEPVVNGGWYKLRAMGRRIFAAASAGAAATDESRFPWRTLLLAATLGAALVGLLRLVVAAAFVVRLRSGRTKIADETILRLGAELRRRLDVRRPVELCESTAVSSPAIVGWRRPIVLLPTNRSGWSDEHLRATLAHELAHAARGDFLWRIAARTAVAFHYGQPLVHWLARQAALAQEAAADRLAAEAIGGAAAYARALWSWRSGSTIIRGSARSPSSCRPCPISLRGE